MLRIVVKTLSTLKMRVPINNRPSYFNIKCCLYSFDSFSIVVFASTAGRLRTCTGAAFASFKKYATHFLNSDCVGTEPKEAPYTCTDKFSKLSLAH
jgi:hypothetical protein